MLVGAQPGGGTLIAEAELKGFFAGNPDDHAIAVEAAKLSMSIEQAQAALAYGRGDPFNQSLKIVEAVNAMTDIGFQGGEGSSPDRVPSPIRQHRPQGVRAGQGDRCGSELRAGVG